MVFMVVSGFLVALAVAIMAVLLFWSWPGKPRPFLDEGGNPLPGSISEKVRVDINGFEQGMFLRAKRQDEAGAALPSRRHARVTS